MSRYYDRLEYLETYPMYSQEYAIAIKNANSQYENALKLADTSHKLIAIANYEFIQLALEIVKNCTDSNNTMCQNKGNIVLNKYDGELRLYFIGAMTVVTIIIICKILICSNTLRE